MHRQPLRISGRDTNGEEVERLACYARNIYARDGAEFLDIKEQGGKQRVFRLDRIEVRDEQGIKLI